MQFKKETTVGIFILVSICSFAFMCYRIGFFKLDTMDYIEYTAHLKTAIGLTAKAEVKIAGVKIGWLKSLDIAPQGNYVIAKLMLLKKYTLYDDAEIIVRQDGPLGTKFIEINPGHSDKHTLSNKEVISDLKNQQPSLDDIFASLATITKSITELLNKLQDPTSENMQQMKEIINNCSTVLSRVSSLSQRLETYCDQTDLVDSLENLTMRVPKVLDSTERMVLDVSAASQSVKAVADKINGATESLAGDKNFFSKITTEPNQTFLTNLTSRANKFFYCLDAISNIGIGLDNNYEFLMNQHSNKNFKSLFNLWVHPSSNYFFVGGANFSKNGYVKRSIKVLKGEGDSYKLENSSKIKKNAFALNLQAGGYFKNFILRVGLFESTPGLALDCLLPFSGPRFKWITSFEAFDFTGKNKIEGYRCNPHLKWMNRVYFTPNLYLAFGADDFANKEKRFGFVGVGLNFGDTYFKNLFS